MPRVLIVDDEPHVLASLRRLCCRAGHEVAVAGSGAEGLAALESFGPDAVISDFRMSPMDGLEFLREVESRRPSAARVLLSGDGDLEGLERPGPGYRFLPKPWDNHVLIEVLEGAIAGGAEE